MKAESEAERSDYKLQKNLQYAGEDGKKTGKKKHDKNEREDWRTGGELLINSLSFTQLAQSHGLLGFPPVQSLSDLQIFCSKSSCRLLEYKRTFFWCCRTSFFTLIPARMRYACFVSASFTLTTMAVGNTSECFASVLSPWRIWAHKNSPNWY